MSAVSGSTPEIFVVDDDPTARESIATLLAEAGFRVTLFADGVAVINEARARVPACIILDLHMPGGSGLDILAKLDARHYAAPMLVVSGRSDIPCVVEAIKRGAFDYIEKHRAAEDLVPRVREAVDAIAQRPSDYGIWDPARPTFPGAPTLTPREHEVLAQIVGSASNKEAAARLGISRRTVEIHRAHIMQKLGAKNSVDLMRIVMSRAPDEASPNPHQSPRHDPRQLTA
ncbi:MAG TPA: response regulator [Xanthobacteraceae bacterium]|nr:response regulator [Xanthobacteraceae bacterium]